MAIELLGINPVRGRAVLLKPNFSTADPFPASTHNDALRHLVRCLGQMGSGPITVGERAGPPPPTHEVIRAKGIDRFCQELGVDLFDFETLPETEWQRVRPPASHWRDGFDVPAPLLRAESVVCTCCLKTHRYGGVFTMSLKLGVGFVHKRQMRELHGAGRHMRKMIAEINQVYRPALIVMDGNEVFVDGGPMQGVKKSAGVKVAGTDRVAVDAVGLAVLKELGANRAIMEQPIFAQEQIARAVELKLGVAGPGAIDIVTSDRQSRDYGDRLAAILQGEAAG